MTLLEFIKDPVRSAELARRVGTSPAWLYQIATSWKGKRASITMAQAIERESGLMGSEAVSKESLRPDVWPPAEKDGDHIADAVPDVESPQGGESEIGDVHVEHGLPREARAA